MQRHFVSRLLPAGVPRGLRDLRQRIGVLLAGAPVVFLAVVLGVALVFRVGIDLLRPHGVEDDSLSAAPVLVASARPAPTTAARADEPAASATAARSARPGGPTPLPAHRRPRSHGKR